MSQRDFVTAARALGAPPARLIVRHVLPNVAPTIIVMAALGTSGTLLFDAALSFLGLGVPPPTPSWGRMIEEATIYFRVAPWLATFPGLAIFYAVLGLTCSATGTCGGARDEAGALHHLAGLTALALAMTAWSRAGCQSADDNFGFPPGAKVLPARQQRRRAEARSGRRLRHRFVDLRAGDF